MNKAIMATALAVVMLAMTLALVSDPQETDADGTPLKEGDTIRIGSIDYHVVLAQKKYTDATLDGHRYIYVIGNGSDTLVDEALDDTTEHRLRLLRKAIPRLTPEEQLLVSLFYREEKSLQEMASITGLKEGNLKVKLHRIRKKLYLLMKEEEEKR